ncbi:MAG: hypothetical protein JW723_06285 [Bacteroidales bacterium]|nr:hypothetical protein [Bacteroidales bacterium]
MYRIATPSFKNEDDLSKWYIAYNLVEGNENVSALNWNGGMQTKISLEKIKLDRPWPSMPINEQTALEVYHSVLDNAGAILPVRDAVDSRIIEETRGGFATYEGVGYKEKNKVSDPSEKCGIIDTQNDVGGCPLLKSTPAPKDTDHDGMPDEWELNNGPDPNSAGDRNAISEEGYTMLENYLNSIN